MINLQSEPDDFALPKPPSMMNNSHFTSSTSSSSNGGGFASTAINFLNSSSTNSNPGLLEGGLNMPNNKSGETIFEKGFNVAKTGANTVSNGAMNLIQRTQTAISDSPFSMTPQRLFYSSIAACIGIFLIFMSFFFLPFAIVTPSFFSFPFTLGSISVFVSLSIMKGYGPFIKHLMSKERWPFSLAYVSSLLFSLFFTVVHKSYIFVVLFSIAQFAALFSFLISYVPGGTSFLSYIGGAIWSSITGIFRGQRRERYLPF